MNTIKDNYTKEFNIQKSKFITKIYPIDSIDNIQNILDNLQKEYKDATHICYAYIIGNIKRASDNGEPSGTAGMPMLNVLEQKNLTHILAVVIRYFGGIKLGAGGLVRAYSNCLAQTIDSVKLAKLIDGITLEIYCDYTSLQQVEKLLENALITKKEFQEKIILECEIGIEEYINIKENLLKYCINVKEKEHLLIRK